MLLSEKRKTAYSWREAAIDATTDHFELRFGSAGARDWTSWVLVARVARPRARRFRVQFIIAPDNPKHLQMIAATKADLDFFLVKKGESDPWAYALYHCGTSSNIYSSVHWSFVAGWHARESEVLCESHRERDLYKHSSDESAYRDFFWSHKKGIHRGGEFPVAVVRKKYKERGYHCWISAQSKHGVDSYLLERMPGKRRQKDPAYLKMVEVFGSLLDEFHQLASAARQLNGLSKPGGDPDLFVQCRDDPSDRFFVEVKLEDLTGRRRYKDEPNKQQRVLFPLIEKKLNCEVKLDRVRLQSEPAQ